MYTRLIFQTCYQSHREELAMPFFDTQRCGLYELTREMLTQFASSPVDKLAGLFYLLRTLQLPCYDATTTDEEVWARSFHLLHLTRRVEVLLDFPYRASDSQWFPTWRQVMEWPERDPNFNHTTLAVESPQIASAVKRQSSSDSKHGLLLPGTC